MLIAMYNIGTVLPKCNVALACMSNFAHGHKNHLLKGVAAVSFVSLASKTAATPFY